MPNHPRYRDLIELFDISTRRYSQRPLFGVKQARAWRWITYRDFASDVHAVRAALHARGLRAGDRVALIAGNSPAWATVAFAVYGIGAVLVPIFPSSRHDDWLYILRDSGARFAMCGTSGIATRALRVGQELDQVPTVVCFDERVPDGAESLSALRHAGGALTHDVEPPDPQATCTLIYTSGTTGRSKGVELTHHNIASNLSALHQIFPVTEADVSLCFLPWAHAFGQVVELYGLFSVGASMALAENDQRLMHNLLEVRPTLLFSVPKLFNVLHDSLRARVTTAGSLAQGVFESALDNARARRRLREQGKARGWVELKSEIFDRMIFERARKQLGGRVRYAVCGGAPLAPEVADLVDSMGITLYEGYGLTETSPIVSANWPGARKLGSVGKPLPGVRVELDRSQSHDGAQGELIVYGDNVMRGYYGMPEENARAFTADGGFRTGDLGYIDGDGFLFVTGRIKETFKLDSGRFVVPSPIEESIRLSPMIKAAMLHGEGRPYAVALLVPELPAIRGWAKQRELDVATDHELLHHPAVLSLLEREVAERTRGVRTFERVGGFLVLDRDFCQEDGTLTATHEIRRGIISRRYADRIDVLYGVHRGRAHAVDE